jgi:hypothetical protein
MGKWACQLSKRLTRCRRTLLTSQTMSTSAVHSLSERRHRIEKYILTRQALQNRHPMASKKGAQNRLLKGSFLPHYTGVE